MFERFQACPKHMTDVRKGMHMVSTLDSAMCEKQVRRIKNKTFESATFEQKTRELQDFG